MMATAMASCCGTSSAVSAAVANANASASAVSARQGKQVSGVVCMKSKSLLSRSLHLLGGSRTGLKKQVKRISFLVAVFEGVVEGPSEEQDAEPAATTRLVKEEVEDLKQALVVNDSLYGTERGLRASSGETRGEFLSPDRGENLWNVSSYSEGIPTQAESVTGATSTIQAEFKSPPDLDYLQELLAIQESGPRAIGFFGTRNMGFMHQQLIEILSYAMVITKNHIYTSGASGTNAAVIRGALRAESPELLTVLLPQSLKKQPPESQELLAKVKNVIEMPHNDHLPLLEASRLCNMDILSHVQQVICFAFHDSNLLMETCREAKNLRKIVTLFYLD